MKINTLSVFTAALAAVLIAPVAMGAIWVEVPVVGLEGYYGWGTPTQKTGSFTVSIDPDAIIRARVRIIGNLVWPSYYGCPGGEAGVNGAYFSADMATSSGEWFTDVVYVDQRVSFVAYLDWQPSDSTTWDFLSSGSGTFVLTGTSRSLPEGCSYDHGSSDTTAEIIDAKMMFELFDPSPVEQSTWGRVKSLFLSE